MSEKNHEDYDKGAELTFKALVNNKHFESSCCGAHVSTDKALTQISAEFLVKFPLNYAILFSQDDDRDPVLICLASFGWSEKKIRYRKKGQYRRDDKTGNGASVHFIIT